MTVSVIDSNDFSPVFAQGSYVTTVTENDDLSGTPGIAAGSTIATVSATDADGTETLAGQIEYSIASGHFLGNDQLFDIPLPNVSIFYLYIHGQVQIHAIDDICIYSYSKELLLF